MLLIYVCNFDFQIPYIGAILSQLQAKYTIAIAFVKNSEFTQIVLSTFTIHLLYNTLMPLFSALYQIKGLEQ